MAQTLIFDIEDDELEILFEDINEHLQALEAGLLQLESGTGDLGDILNAVFRAAHTLKAVAGTVGHHTMAELTHTMENLFDAMRVTLIPPGREMVDDLLSAVDVLRLQRDEIVTREPSGADVAGLMDRLRNAQNGNGHNGNNGHSQNEAKASGGAAPAPISIKLDDTLREAAKELMAGGLHMRGIRVASRPDAFAPSARLSQAALALAELGEVLAQQPSMAELAQGGHTQIEFMFISNSSKEEIQTLLDDIVDLEPAYIVTYGETTEPVEPIAPAEPEAAAPAEPEAATPAPEPAAAAKPVPAKANGKPGRSNGKATQNDLAVDKTVRISVERLDSLMNLVGELVTDRNRLQQFEETIRVQNGRSESAALLGELAAHLGRVVDQVQEEVMRARMLPIGNLFNKFPRIVRDVARIAKKDVKLVIEGEDTELDRTLIEVIGDPLIHLIRNAVDHGVEPPEERRRIGKDPTGIVKLSAEQVEGQITITITDDGRGIDPDKIRRAAVRKGMLSEEEAAKMDDEAAVDFIFQPSLSTADKVTEVSGRGVGMDVVRANVERLSGSVIVESVMGQGSKFQVTLPLTLAIVQAMLVEVWDVVYAIPLAGIIESLYLAEAEVQSIKGNRAIRWRDTVVPLLDLHDFFHDTRIDTDQRIETRPAIIIVAWGKLRVGLLVNRIIGKQGIVVKSLSKVIGDAPGLSGATILGDGKVALIVDIPSMMNATLQHRRQGV